MTVENCTSEFCVGSCCHAKHCVCQICTCGRHHCPHQRKKIAKGPCQISEYTNRYRPFPIDLRNPFKPKTELRKQDVPMEDKTNHRIDYVPHELQKRFVRDQDIYKRPDQPMDMNTMYKTNYTGKTGPPTKAIRQDGHRKVPGKFDGEPTYRADYKKWALDPRKRHGPDQCWSAPTIPFGNLSTNQNDYPGYVEPVRGIMRPPYTRLASDQPFDDNTDYRQSYVRHPIPPRFQRQPDLYKGPTVPLDTLTTVQRDYQGKQGPKVDSCKPDNSKVGSDAPMDDITTVRADYKEWPLQKIPPHQHPPYVKPDGDFDANTTYNINYVPKRGDRAMTCRPMPARKMGGPFDGSTIYRQEYKKWDGHRPPKALMRPEMVVSSAPFDGISTTRAHYTSKPMAFTKSCKPIDKGMRSGEPFDDSTMYRLEYTGKKLVPCPVPTLEYKGSGYEFDGMDTRGHRVYHHLTDIDVEVPYMAQNPLPAVREMTVA